MFKELKEIIENSINIDVKKLEKEELFSLKLVKEKNIKTIINYIKENTNISEHIRKRYSSFISMPQSETDKIKNDNIELFNEIIKLSPELADQYLESFFINNEIEKENAIYVKDNTDIFNLEKKISLSKEFKYEAKIVNPFTNYIIKGSFSNNNIIEQNKMETSYLIQYPELFNERKINSSYNVNISLSETYKFRTEFSFIRDVSRERLSFMFALYHELAHASLAQMTQKNSYEKENNSDLSAIIKIIKNYNFNQEESQLLCNDIIRFRTNTANLELYIKHINNNELRDHYTIKSIFALKKILESDLEEIKKIPDEEISRYSAMIINLNKNLLMNPEMENNISKAVDKIILKYNIENLKYGPISNIEEWFNNDHIKIFLKRLEIDKNACEDIILTSMLKENISNLKKIYNYYSYLNPNIAKELNKEYKNYQTNKKEQKIEIKKEFNETEFRNSIKKIKYNH